MGIFIVCDENLKPDEHEMVFDYDWEGIGYDEKGRLIQYNKNTKEFRFFEKWVEIFKDGTEKKPVIIRERPNNAL